MNPTNDPERITCSHSTGLNLRPVIWLAVTTAIYLITFYFLSAHPEWAPARRIAMALAPVLPGLGYLKSISDSFRAMDELQRRIQMEAWGFALVGTLLITTVMNVLNANGMTLGSYPHGLQLGGVYMTMFFLWSIGVAIANFRYR